LTKPIFLALIVCVVRLFVVVFFHPACRLRATSLVGILAFRAGSLARLLCAFPPGGRIRQCSSVVSAWVPLWHTSYRDPFYQMVLGLDLPFLNLETMVTHFIFM